jgi:hypothetical protein
MGVAEIPAPRDSCDVGAAATGWRAPCASLTRPIGPVFPVANPERVLEQGPRGNRAGLAIGVCDPISNLLGRDPRCLPLFKHQAWRCLAPSPAGQDCHQTWCLAYSPVAISAWAIAWLRRAGETSSEPRELAR